MALPKSPIQLMEIACETNDTSLVLKAIDLNDPSVANYRAESILDYGLHKAIRMNSKDMIRFLLDHGAEVATISAGKFELHEKHDGITLDTLEFLVENGWDINSWSSDKENHHQPLLWYALGRQDVIDWCLERNARLDIFDERLLQNKDFAWPDMCPPLLDVISRGVSIDKFKFFSERGAIRGFRMLHNAVSTARVAAPVIGQGEPDASEVSRYLESLEMVEFLLKLDTSEVNTFKGRIGDDFTTPLSLVAQKGSKRDIAKLVFLLLDAGADVELEDPDCGGKSAIWMANFYRNSAFLDALENWRTK